jgi:squalene-associated FAD-dependent desaturase
MTADVVVIGAGFAGLSAAVKLADAGRRVVVVEQAPRLGGRATAFTDRESGERVDNGQHVLFGCYRATFEFLRRIGTDTRAPLDPTLRLAMAGRDGQQFELRCPPLPAPWHLVGGLMRWKAIATRDRLAALRLRHVLVDGAREGPAAVAARVPAGWTVSDWLANQRQTVRLNEWLWHPLAFAALNQSPDVAAARPFVRVLAELFGPRPDDAAVGLPAVPLDELYGAPAAAAIESLGGHVILKAPARVIVAAGGPDSHVGRTFRSAGSSSRIAGVHAATEAINARAVISSVAWHSFGSIWAAGVPPEIAAVAADASRMKSSPIVTVNLWLDAPAPVGRFVGLAGGPMHWVFSKGTIYGDDTAHLSVVSSGADDLTAMENAEVTRVAWSHLQEALPPLRDRRLRRSVVVREHRATFSLAPGAPPRPPARTPLRGFYLAGDWTDTGLPGTIEGAVRSGHAAADLLLADWPIITG